jgi:hypothetical protein
MYQTAVKKWTTSVAGLLAAWLVLSARPVRAQIVNTQPLIARAGTAGLSGELRLNFDWRTGNTDLLRVIGSKLLFYRHHPHTLIWSSRIDYGRADGSDFESQLFSHLRYQHAFSQLFTWEVFLQASTAKIKRLELRALAGTGPRLRLSGSEKQFLALGLSYMFEHERTEQDTLPQAGTRTSHHRLSSYLTARLALAANIICNQTIFFQPRLDAFTGDFRILSISDLAIPLSKRFSLTCSFELAWDKDPPATVKKVDTMLTLGAGWSF